jgi:uroporphyrinogen decarboxylase
MDPRRQRFLAALAGAPHDRPPVWLMRQAVRYLPGYRELRRQYSFWDVCHSAELSTRAALEPLKLFKLDAAIVFSDILVVLNAMGLEVTFGPSEGPRIGHPLRSEGDLASWNLNGVMERLSFLPRAVAHLARTLDGSHGILGFAGAPFTLFCYAVDGGSSEDFRAARIMLHRNPTLAKRALETLADVLVDLTLAKVEAGADAVQLFDTWGGLLSLEEYEEFCVPVLKRIFEQLGKRGVPTILFARGGHHLLPALGRTGASGFSLDWRMDWTEVRRQYPNHLLQGNIDPLRLLAGEAHVREATRRLLATMRAAGNLDRSIVNLGHGILPETPSSAVAALCDEVAAFSS